MCTDTTKCSIFFGMVPIDINAMGMHTKKESSQINNFLVYKAAFSHVCHAKAKFHLCLDPMNGWSYADALGIIILVLVLFTSEQCQKMSCHVNLPLVNINNITYLFELIMTKILEKEYNKCHTQVHHYVLFCTTRIGNKRQRQQNNLTFIHMPQAT